MKATKLPLNRDFYNVPWYEDGRASEIQGATATLKFHNHKDGAKSSTVVVNGDGHGGPVSVSAGWTGKDKLTVAGSDGGEFVIEEVTFG